MEDKKRRGTSAVMVDGRDEMNLAEFPIASLSEKVPDTVKTLEFCDVVHDPRTAEPVTRRLIVSASDRFGLPAAKDDEVIVGAIQLTKLANFESPKVHFSRYELIEILGWDHGGKSYARIDLALSRWVGVTLFWDNAWWDKGEESWVNVKFGIFDNVELYDRERINRRRAQQVPLALSSFKWNEVVFSSFQAGYLKHLDLNVFRGLGSSGAKRMYRFLDKHFYRKSRVEFDLYRFAYEKVGMSRVYGHDAGRIKEKLRPWIAELEQAGIIAACADNERFVRLGKGSWQVVFERAPEQPQAEQLQEPSVVSDLTCRGVTPSVAMTLASMYAADRVAAKVELFDWYATRGEKKSPGWLRKAIEDDYSLPEGFETAAQKAENARRRAEAKQREQSACLAEEMRLREEREAREAKLQAALSKYSCAQLEDLEEQAVAAASGFIRQRYLKAKTEGGPSFEQYRRMVLEEFLFRNQ